jgi:hypothetical protein
MPNGDNFILGKDNTASDQTSLVEPGGGFFDKYVLSVGSDQSVGVAGRSRVSRGVLGRSDDDDGVEGFSNKKFGVFGFGLGLSGSSNSAGVYGLGNDTIGVLGTSTNSNGVVGKSTNKNGVRGESTNTSGVVGKSTNSIGVSGFATKSFGVGAWSEAGNGVYAHSDTSTGVFGESNSGTGVFGTSLSGVGVVGLSSGNLAARFVGDVEIQGKLFKPGGGFKIDHPLNPDNSYLCHSFVESSEMKNIYDGVAVLDEAGEALVDLPEWFGELNDHFRYQLTPIGAAGPNLHIAEKINNDNRFKIGGGEPQMEVSWQLTGIRKDKWAKANQIEVEEEKSDEERGYYLHPELYGQPEELGIGRAEVQEQLQQLEGQLGQEPLEVPSIDVAGLEEEHRRQMEELRRGTEGQEGEAPY